MSRKILQGTGPKARQPRQPQGNQIHIAHAQHQISFDPRAFAQFVQSQGLKVTHFRAMPDPTGMQSRGDVHGDAGNRKDSDGFIYKKAGTASILFSTNSDNWDMQVEGVIQYSTAVVTLPAKYDDTNEAFLVAPFDRFYLEDVEVRVVNMQYIESNSNGIDRLQFPATSVESLVDSDNIEYHQHKDFEITEGGDIHWISQKRPGWNVTLNRGKIYSIRYRYVPFFIVARLMHEIRVSQVTDPATYKRYVERMPYQVSVVREYVFQDKNNDPTKPVIDHRFQLAPPVGGSTGPK